MKDIESVTRRYGTNNVVYLALATSGALMLMVAYLRWADHIAVLWGAVNQ